MCLKPDYTDDFCYTFLGRISKEGQQKEMSDSVFYCEPKSKDKTEDLSVSTTSSTVVEDCDNGGCDGKLLDCTDETCDMTGSIETKNWTGSYSKDLETPSDQNEPKENFLRPGVNLSASRSERNTRQTASWEVITRKDITNAQLEELDLQNSASAMTTESKHSQEQGQASGQGHASGHGQMSGQGHLSSQPQGHPSSQGQSSEEAVGKAGKFMSTFSTLKKMRIGRKQTPETAASSKNQSTVIVLLNQELGFCFILF